MLPEEEILAVEAERKARWDRVAEHMRALVEMDCGGIVDSREAALILEHVAGLEAIVVRLSSDAAAQAQESKAALEEAVAAAETDQRTIDRLLLDLHECRAHLGGVLEELGKVRAERGDAQADLAQAVLETDRVRAERDAALARLSEPRPEQSGGVVVVELGVRLGVMVR